jgi:hypothetical protein
MQVGLENCPLLACGRSQDWGLFLAAIRALSLADLAARSRLPVHRMSAERPEARDEDAVSGVRPAMAGIDLSAGPGQDGRAGGRQRARGWRWCPGPTGPAWLPIAVSSPAAATMLPGVLGQGRRPAPVPAQASQVEWD